MFFLDAKYTCSPFLDVQSDLRLFEGALTYKSSAEVQSIQKELTILNMVYLLFGLLLNEYPDNYAFELTSRLLILYNLKANITNLLKQCDEQSPRHCALIVPYCQLTPPGNGLLYSMNKHTMPVVDLDFTNGQKAAISLSNKIIVINMSTGNTALDIKLPQLKEPYLNCTTLPKAIIYHTNQTMNNKKDDAGDSNDSDSDNEEEEKYKQCVFFVNSFHHVYLVSSHGDIKFHQTSMKGYSTIDILDAKRHLCILVEQNSNTVECWDLGQNKLFSTINLSSNLSIKTVLCTKLNSLIVIIVLYDGTILFYAVKNSTFIHRGTINAGKHLDLVVVDIDKLICTFKSPIPTDFAHIDLHSLTQTEKVLSDKEMIKTLITFNPPMSPKPIVRIVLPDEKKSNGTDKSMKIFFMALTKECLYIVHICMAKGISYVRIPGQYDVVAAHVSRPHYIFTARGGIVSLHKWKCLEGEDDLHGNCNIYHQYQLFVSIDISSSPVLTIRPSGDSGKYLSIKNNKTVLLLIAGLFLCSMQNGVINAYHSLAAREAFKKLPPFPRTTQLISMIELSGTKAVTLDVSKQ
jgi:hypothetical protein